MKSSTCAHKHLEGARASPLFSCYTYSKYYTRASSLCYNQNVVCVFGWIVSWPETYMPSKRWHAQTSSIISVRWRWWYAYATHKVQIVLPYEAPSSVNYSPAAAYIIACICCCFSFLFFYFIYLFVHVFVLVSLDGTRTEARYLKAGSY